MSQHAMFYLPRNVDVLAGATTPTASTFASRFLSNQGGGLGMSWRWSPPTVQQPCRRNKWCQAISQFIDIKLHGMQMTFLVNVLEPRVLKMFSRGTNWLMFHTKWQGEQNWGFAQEFLIQQRWFISSHTLKGQICGCIAAEANSPRNLSRWRLQRTRPCGPSATMLLGQWSQQKWWLLREVTWKFLNILCNFSNLQVSKTLQRGDVKREKFRWAMFSPGLCLASDSTHLSA